ncbi:NAD-dependent protein deacylase [candidate division LCP-89 bacterium B3_LCP]|uniref:protein acetyllysine N-acetyltransferase n=1 Tax=candidate division LCP-89 bacterium B3_LCP TaxID=2012998 RepID=A0A532UXN8_UNCL8|nr:MAG: NAD-dependent protein deacylase [candidate division LCP-89 bacterium B3_LCP]
MPSDDLSGLCEAIAKGNVVAFTGAGVSEESGIPTYRGTDGFWTKYDPDKYASIAYFEKDPSYYWSFFKDTRGPLLHDAKPNSAHIALAELEEKSKVNAVITQNIDGLHQVAGSQNVIELHGSSRAFHCMKCRKGYNLPEAEEAVEKANPPICTDCGGILRPDIVFFGEMLPPGAIEKAFDLARQCSLFLVVGSSLVVYPAAQAPVVAVEAGAELAIINVDPTPVDHLAKWIVHEKAGEVLPKLIEE